MHQTHLLGQYSVKIMVRVYNPFCSSVGNLIQHKLTTLSMIVNHLQYFLHVKNGDVISMDAIP